MMDRASRDAEDEIARLNYIQDSDIFSRQKPYEVLSEVPVGLEKSNFKLRPGSPETIHDIRGRESHFDLDRNGFQVVPHVLETTLFDEDTITREYLPAVELLLKAVHPGADIHVFDWQLRSSDLPDPEPGTSINLNDPILRLKPVQAVHVDQSPWSAMKRARSALDSEPDDFRNKRIRIINVWRPILNPIENYPLAVCDGSTVTEENLMRVDHVRKHHIGESLYPLQSADYRWYYLNRQSPDEVLLFKIFDSKEGVQAKCCPHTSFVKEKVLPLGEPRESIEVRTLVVS